MPFAGLVPGEHLVAKRLDHVIERARHVRHAGLGHQPPQHREKALGGPDLAPSGAGGGRPGKVGSEKLEGAVDQVDFHERTVAANRARVVRAQHRPDWPSQRCMRKVQAQRTWRRSRRRLSSRPRAPTRWKRWTESSLEKLSWPRAARVAWLRLCAVGALLHLGCTLITDVDRTKIPQPPPFQPEGDAGETPPEPETDAGVGEPDAAAGRRDGGSQPIADAAPTGDGG